MATVTSSESAKPIRRLGDVTWRRFVTSLWWPAKARRWRKGFLLGVALTVLIVGLTVLAISGRADRACSGRNIGCGVVVNFVITSLVGLVGYLYLISLRLRRTVGSYLRTARDRPQGLLTTAPYGVHMDRIVGRGELNAGIASELRASRHGGIQVMLGEAGSGKTTFLLGLASYLARRGAVPVMVSLRGQAAPLQLRALAKERFISQIDINLRSAGEADQFWRMLSSEGSIVVLADGLDEAALGSSTDERTEAILAALDEARNARLPVVVTSRAEGAPPTGRYPDVLLPPLTSEQAEDYILGRLAPVGQPAGEDRERIRQVTRLLDVTGTPFYLNVVASLLEAGRLVDLEAGERGLLRLKLLDGHTEAVADGTLPKGVTLGADQRIETLEGLARIAGAMTLRGKLEYPMSLLRDAEALVARELRASLLDLVEIVENGRRLGYLQVYRAESERQVRFGHTILQAYFTQRLFNTDEALWRFVLDGTLATTELMTALEMWCLHRGDPAHAHTVATALLEQSVKSRGDGGLRLAVTAAEILGGRLDAATTVVLEKRIVEAWERASQPARLAAVPRIRALDLAWGYRFLYTRFFDPDWVVRWTVAEAIAQGGDLAYEILQQEIEDAVVYAEQTPSRQWRSELGQNLAMFAILLPALGTAATGQAHDDIRRLVERLVEAAVRGNFQAGGEAALAQGFKLDAMRFPDAPIDPQACRLLPTVRFWYAKMMLVQAICRRAVGRPERDREALRLLRRVARDDDHPLVVLAARLCVKAIVEGRWEPYVWDDESTVILRSSSPLTPQATSLVADVVLLLNLIEQAHIQGDRRDALQSERRLPFCMSVSSDRSEFRRGCHSSCTFGACPYPLQAPTTARGAFSEGFCRQRAALVLHGRKRPPWQQMSARTTRRFWEEMADEARA
jgi:hypothetical protein